MVEISPPYPLFTRYFVISSRGARVESKHDESKYDVTLFSKKVAQFRRWKKKGKIKLTWSLVVGIFFTAGVRLPLWMMVLMPTMSPLPRQMHAHVHRVRPVTWKQMKEIPCHAVFLNRHQNLRRFRMIFSDETRGCMHEIPCFPFVRAQESRKLGQHRLIA